MKIIIKKTILFDALKNINNIVDNSNGNIQLSAVHIYTKDNQLYLCATKGSASYQEIIKDVKIKKDGDILIKARFFFNIISKIHDAELTINQLDTSILQIKTPTYSCEINLLDNYSYPNLNFDHSDWDKINLDFDTIANIYYRVKLFVCSTDVYTVAQGIFFNAISEKEMECISSDHYRAAYYRFEYTGKQTKFVVDPEMIKFSHDIMLSKKAKTVDIYIKEKNCMVQLDNIILSFALFENSYPNIIPRILQKTKNSFTIKLNDLYDALSRGTVFVADEQRPVVNLTISENKLNIKFVSNESGNSFEQIDLINSSVKNYEAKLNQKLFMELIGTIKSETITFNFDGQFMPIILSTENKNFLNLIMVMQSV